MTEVETDVRADADVNVKKPKRGRRGRRRDTLREAILATTQLFADLSTASADAFGAFADEIARGDDDLVRTVATGVAEGNATYMRAVADSPRRYVDRLLSTNRRRRRGEVEIDYDRLAKLVAAELSKRDTPG